MRPDAGAQPLHLGNQVLPIHPVKITIHSTFLLKNTAPALTHRGCITGSSAALYGAMGKRVRLRAVRG
jgi:hypothetical protein